MMQTIDAIRRTNELSKVLKNHGLATDNFDAVRTAHQMTSDEPSEILKSESMEGSDRLMQKLANIERSKHLLSGRVDQLQNALAEQEAAYKQVVARLDSAESKLRHLRNQPAAVEQSVAAPEEPKEEAQIPRGFPQGMPANSAPAQQAAPAVPPPAPSAPTQSASAQAPPAQQSHQRHPRQAAMDEKFSIENVFYCGTK